jgi:two-component system chemotaxis response regulator CheB
MGKVRVLIVDESTAMRRLLSRALAEDPRIEVVGTAASGRIGLAKIPQINPDLVTLNLEMPFMDGLTTLTELRKAYPRLPVIMCSPLTHKGAAAALNALSSGASDYFCRPANVANPELAIRQVQEELIPKIKALCDSANMPNRFPSDRASGNCTQAALRNAPVEVIAIGVSTGGPKALADILCRLPGNFPVPILIVQHMPPEFTKYLAMRLSTVSPIEVHEAIAGEIVRPGRVWLAPGNFHMSVARSIAGVTIHLDQSPPENSCRPAVDVLFRSVAELYGSASIGVVLTGMGNDSLRGCEAIHEAGGRIIVQDTDTSVVWGMPGAVAKAGLSDHVLPLNRIADKLCLLVHSHRHQQSLHPTTSIDA